MTLAYVDESLDLHYVSDLHEMRTYTDYAERVVTVLRSRLGQFLPIFPTSNIINSILPPSMQTGPVMLRVEAVTFSFS